MKKNAIRDFLFEFLRTLPPDYDSSKITVKEAFEMIEKFMEKYGLKNGKN